VHVPTLAEQKEEEAKMNEKHQKRMIGHMGDEQYYEGYD